MRHISVHGFKEVVAAEQGNTAVDFINVCTPAEYKEGHIEGVRNVPLDEIGNRLTEFSGKQTIFVHCRSGRRAQQAIEKMREQGVEADFVNVEGGIQAWTEAGFATRTITNRLPIMRQVLLTAGLLIITSVVLGFLVNGLFFLAAGAIGCGLSFAGATGWCGMSFLLAKMPWNK